MLNLDVATVDPYGWENPPIVTLSRERRDDWDPSADAIMASGLRAAQTGRTHDRTRPANSDKASCQNGAVHT